MMRESCYFGAEACRKGHAPDCPAIGLHQAAERYRAFYGEPKALPPLTDESSHFVDSAAYVYDIDWAKSGQPHRTATAAPAPAGYLQGATFIAYPRKAVPA